MTDTPRLDGRIRLATEDDLDPISYLYIEQATRVPHYRWQNPHWRRSDACYAAFCRAVHDDTWAVVRNHGSPGAASFVAVYEHAPGVVAGLVRWTVAHRSLNGGRAPQVPFAVRVGRNDLEQIGRQVRAGAAALRGRDGVYFDEFRAAAVDLFRERALAELVGRRARNGARSGVVRVDMVCVAQAFRAGGVGNELVAYAVAKSRREGYYVSADVSDPRIRPWLRNVGFGRLSDTAEIAPAAQAPDRRQTLRMEVWGLLPRQRVKVVIDGEREDQPDGDYGPAF